MKKRQMHVWLGIGLGMLMLPATAMAERPEIDCNTLPDDEVQRFYELSGQMSQAAEEQDFDKAFSLAKQAMSICTSDTYTEFMLARLYHRSNDCANAYYHYEILDSRPSSVKKENSDVYKKLPEYLKEVKAKCGDAVNVEIVCALPETSLQIQGLSVSNLSCPYYGKVKPGSYPLVATKTGYMPYKDTLTVSAGGTQFQVPELTESGSTGYIRVRCPKGASKFVMVSSNGVVEEYVCPWEGEVAPDTYKIYLGGSTADTATTVTIGKKERVEHVIPSLTTNCNGQPQGGHHGLFGFAVGLLGLLGLGAVSRRRAVASKAK